MSGDECDYIRSYAGAHRTFPHESTSDQLFSEEQFEVYRALGEHVALGLVTGRDAVAFAKAADLTDEINKLVPILEV
jgi:hypothetical protein